MPNEDNKILKYNYGEKSLKFQLLFMLNYAESYIEKELSIYLLVIHCLQVVHLMKQKISLIVTKMKFVWEGFAMT